MSKLLRLLALVAASNSLAGCQSTRVTLAEKLQGPKRVNEELAFKTGQTKVDPRILKRKGIDPDSREARQLAGEEFNVRNLDNNVRRVEGTETGIHWSTRDNARDVDQYLGR